MKDESTVIPSDVILKVTLFAPIGKSPDESIPVSTVNVAGQLDPTVGLVNETFAPHFPVSESTKSVSESKDKN